MKLFSRVQGEQKVISSSHPSFFVIAVTTLLAIALMYSFTACDSQLIQSENDIAINPDAVAQFGNSHLSGTISNSELNKKLAALRNLTAPYHNIEKAIEDGWFVPLTPCLEHPTEGGMGYHYGNPDFINDQWNVLEPEVLLYEPQKNGRFRLVGVEYIVPFDEYPAGSEPPVLFGQQFSENHGAGVWALHVWIWRNNPSGMFADWNPQVSCKFD